MGSVTIIAITTIIMVKVCFSHCTSYSLPSLILTYSQFSWGMFAPKDTSSIRYTLFKLDTNTYIVFCHNGHKFRPRCQQNIELLPILRATIPQNVPRCNQFSIILQGLVNFLPTERTETKSGTILGPILQIITLWLTVILLPPPDWMGQWSINLWPSDAYMRRKTNQHWFR